MTVSDLLLPVFVQVGLFGNPATCSRRPVALRPRLTTGLPFRLVGTLPGPGPEGQRRDGHQWCTGAPTSFDMRPGGAVRSVHREWGPGSFWSPT